MSNLLADNSVGFGLSIVKAVFVGDLSMGEIVLLLKVDVVLVIQHPRPLKRLTTKETSEKTAKPMNNLSLLREQGGFTGVTTTGLLLRGTYDSERAQNFQQSGQHGVG